MFVEIERGENKKDNKKMEKTHFRYFSFFLLKKFTKIVRYQINVKFH